MQLNLNEQKLISFMCNTSAGQLRDDRLEDATKNERSREGIISGILPKDTLWDNMRPC